MPVHRSPFTQQTGCLRLTRLATRFLLSFMLIETISDGVDDVTTEQDKNMQREILRPSDARNSVK